MAEKTLQTTERNVATAEGRTPSTREETRYQIPPVDIFEAEDGLTVIADLPGVDKDGVEVRVDNGTLTIRGRVNPAVRGNSVYNEFVVLDYFRQFQLSEMVDVGQISAEMKHGVLTIRLPKVEAAKPRQIQVKIA